MCKSSFKLTELFANHNSDLIGFFCNIFLIEYFLFHSNKDRMFIHYPDTTKIDESDCYQFYNEKNSYICILYGHTEDNIIEKFERFLKIKAFT